MILEITNSIFDYFMILMILANILMRNNRYGHKKRFSTIIFAFIFLGFYALLIVADAMALPAWGEYIAVAFLVLMLVLLRKRLFIFSFKCKKCGKRMTIKEMTTYDDNLCFECWAEEHPEESQKEKEREAKKNPRIKSEEEIEEAFTAANTIDEVPWGSWEPTERCVLTYTFDGDKVLLIHKKRGLGEGYVNAPGGHIELEETKLEAAIRETKEETGLDVRNLEEMGTIHFQFKDGLRMIGYVFRTSTFSGELLEETDETKPFWQDLKDLDYSRMWADDPLWVPLLLEGKKFEAYFIFDDKTLVDGRVTEVSDDE